MKAQIRVMQLQAKECQSAIETTESRREAWNRRNQLRLHSDVGCPASGTGRKQISVVQATESVVLYNSSPRKLIQ